MAEERELTAKFQAFGMGNKKGGKKGGSKKGVPKSPQKVVNQGAVFAVFKEDDQFKPYICAIRPGAEIKNIEVKEASLLTFLHPTSDREHYFATYDDGTASVFLSLDNATKISKKQGKQPKAVLKATWVGGESLIGFWEREAPPVAEAQPVEEAPPVEEAGKEECKEAGK
eukprot:g5991.t1